MQTSFLNTTVCKLSNCDAIRGLFVTTFSDRPSATEPVSEYTPYAEVFLFGRDSFQQIILVMTKVKDTESSQHDFSLSRLSFPSAELLSS